MEYDYFVIGQGLAGSVISHELLNRSKKFLVFDDPAGQKSSTVAAGIFNPITGKTWVKSWMADELFPYAIEFYRLIEAATAQKFLHRKEIYRPFDNPTQQNDWVSKSSDSNFSHFLDEVSTEPKFLNLVRNDLGGILLRQSGYLDIRYFLQTTKRVLQDRSCLNEEMFDYREVKYESNLVAYKGITAAKVIFCEGSQNSSIWDFLPFRPVKGEIITIQCEEEFDVIFNKGVFVLPIGDGKYRVGATYDHNLAQGITDQGKEQLLNKLDQFFVCNYEVVDHVSGVRPATFDRRPFLGVHPNYENYVIFNGLGAKGVTLAPYFAKQLLDHLESGNNLTKGVSLDRING